MIAVSSWMTLSAICSGLLPCDPSFVRVLVGAALKLSSTEIIILHFSLSGNFIMGFQRSAGCKVFWWSHIVRSSNRSSRGSWNRILQGSVLTWNTSFPSFSFRLDSVPKEPVPREYHSSIASVFGLSGAQTHCIF